MSAVQPVTFSIPVTDFKRLETPLDHKGYRDYLCIVDIQQLPDLRGWSRSNLRDPRSTGRVPKLIRESLNGHELFVYMNRGLVMVADDVTFDNKKNTVTIRFSRPEMHGLIDGGHTHLIISEEKAQISEKDESNGGPMRQFVKLEILKGFDQSEVTDIAGARNTSNQVQDESLLNLEKRFEPLKKALHKQAFADEIAYKEFEYKADGSPKPIDVRDIISIMYMFDVETFTDQKHPINGYRTKSACLDDFKTKTDPKNGDQLSSYDKTYSLLPDLLKLYDEIHVVLPELYDRSRKEYDQRERGGYGRLKGVGNLKKPDVLPFTGKEVDKRTPAGFVYPILGAFRALIEERDGQYSWVSGCDPFRLLRGAMGLQMAQALGNTARDDQNPSKTGKNQSLWHSCYQAAIIARKDLEIASLSRRPVK